MPDPQPQPRTDAAGVLTEADAAVVSRITNSLVGADVLPVGEALRLLYIIDRLASELARFREDRKTLDAIDKAAGGESVMALIAAGKRLPLTKDGVRVHIGDTVWDKGPKGGFVGCVVVNEFTNQERYEARPNEVGGTYSTRAAAEQAKGGGE